VPALLGESVRPVELPAARVRRRGGVELRQRAGLHRLREEPVAHAEERLERAGRPGRLQVGVGVAGVRDEAAHRRARGPQPAVELEREQDVRELGLRVVARRRVRPLAGQVVEMDPAALVQAGAHRDDARVGAAAEPVQEQAGEREVAEVVGRELALVALRAQRARRHHHAGVVDQEVHLDAVEVVDERADGVEVGEVHVPQVQAGVGQPGPDAGGGSRALLRVADGHDHRGAPPGELAGGDQPEAAVGARDERGAAGLVRDVGGGPPGGGS
jgi:hypothetical protein